MLIRKFHAPLLIAALLFIACSETVTETTADFTVPVDLMGIVHGSLRSPLSDPAVKHQYDIMNDIGVTWILDDFSWQNIQPARDTWDLGFYDMYVQNANEYGIKLLGILVYDTDWLHENDDHVRRCVVGDDEIALYCEYAAKLAERYNGKNGFGKVDAWRIWNEPDGRFWTASMEDYYKLAKAAVSAIHAADPDAVVGVGSLTALASESWIKGLYSSGAATGADYVAYHPYSVSPTAIVAAYNFFLNYSPRSWHNKVWVTETGYPSGGSMPTVVPTGMMPNTIVKTITLLAANGAQRILWYQLRDNMPRNNPADSESWFGMYEKENGVLTPKGKAPDAYKLAALNIPGKTYRINGLAGLDLPQNVQAHYFEGNGKHTLVVWNDSQASSRDIMINLPVGKNYVLHDPGGAVHSETVSAAGTYTLGRSNRSNEKVLFFTWDDE